MTPTQVGNIDTNEPDSEEHEQKDSGVDLEDAVDVIDVGCDVGSELGDCDLPSSCDVLSSCDVPCDLDPGCI